MTQLTRTYYFQGELLGDQDFIRDQQYARDIIAIQNQGLYAPGVALGLQATSSGSVVTLSAGLAFNPYGVPLVALSPVTRDLAGDNLGPGTYNLLLVYSDSLSNHTPPASMQGNHTIIEAPIMPAPLPTTATPPPMAVIVGQVVVAAGGQYTVSATGRQTAHSLLDRAPGLAAPAAAASADAALEAAPGAGQHVASLSVGDPPAALPPAPLTVTRDFGADGLDGSVASFAFSRGGDSGLVALGLPGEKDGYNLLHASFNGQRVWAVDQTGASFSLSDARVKQDIRTLADPLAIVRGFRGVSYRSRIDGAARVGLVAQEVAAALPQAVRVDEAGLHALSYDAVVGVLVEAVKALAARVDTLSDGAAAR